MKTLHFYLLRQILATLLMTVLVFTAVLLLGNVLKSILSLLINQQASLAIIGKAVALLIPFVLVFALPMGMLTATLLVFGRFSADQELTAVRASGISLVALSTPILVLSLVLSGVCAWINLEVAPKCRFAYKDLLFTIGLQSPLTFLPEKQFIRDIPGGYTIYIEKRHGNEVENIFVHQATSNAVTWATAPKGTLVYDDDTRQILLTLFDATTTVQQDGNIQPGHGDFEVPIDLTPTKQRRTEPKLTDMTFEQLRAKIAELETLPEQSRPLPNTAPEEFRQQLESIKTWQKDWVTPAKVQLHRIVSFSFACVGFTLIGIPLGIRAHRRETSVGIAMALVLVLIYYSFIILAQSFDTRPDLAPHLIVWLPNFVFQAVGAVLLWRANRGV